MLKVFLVAVCMCPVWVLAQFHVSGRVLNKADKTPVASASVFLSNTQSGARSGNDGSFTLTNVKPGQYDLVVTVVGFETYHQLVQVNADVTLPDIAINPKTVQLREVKILTDEGKERQYAMFKRLFLGNSPYAANCKILNRDVVDIDYDKASRVLSATSSGFIEIENSDLGYKIKYLLTNFNNDERRQMFYFEGSALFEELKGSKHQQRQWKKNRLQAYRGSSMHFLRTVLSNDLYQQGFKVLRLIRKKNPEYLPGNFKPEYKETIVTSPLKTADFVKKTDVTGLFALSFDDCLYVMYNADQNDTPLDQLVKPGQPLPDFLNNWITTTVIFEAPYAAFDRNGIFTDPSSIIFEGNWGMSRMANMLPVDYIPGHKKICIKN